jgi:ribosomal protein S27E
MLHQRVHNTSQPKKALEVQNFLQMNSTLCQEPNMSIKQQIRCPNCGSHAERIFSNHLTKTQCDTCDYLMLTCEHTGRVVEAYAPGIFFARQSS